jgi:lipopolysaccharide export system permease protein
VARFLPFAVLLGTLITLAGLNQNSEVIAMKAAGISAHQIIAPLIVASLFIAGLTYIFQERIVTRATATLRAWEAVEYGPLPKETELLNNVWVRQGDDLIFAAVVTGRGEAARLRGVKVYERSGGTLQATVEAEAGERSGDGWLLRNAERFDIADTTLTKLPTLLVGRGVDPTQFTLARVDPAEQDLATLRDSIDQMRVAGRPTSALEAGLWHKLSGPLSALLMPLLAAVAAFGLARSGQLFLRAVLGWRSASLTSSPTISRSRWAISAPIRRCSRPGPPSSFSS